MWLVVVPAHRAVLMVDQLIYSSSSQFTTRLTKAVVCTILYGMMHMKDPLLLIEKSSPNSGNIGFLLLLWFFTICPMPYNHE